MIQIERNLYLKENHHMKPIEVVAGSHGDIDLFFRAVDFTISDNTTVTAIALAKGSSDAHELSSSVDAYGIHVYPDDGFFVAGINYLQLEIGMLSSSNSESYSFMITVKCERNLLDGVESSADYESVKSYAERAEAAAIGAETANALADRVEDLEDDTTQLKQNLDDVIVVIDGYESDNKYDKDSNECVENSFVSGTGSTVSIGSDDRLKISNKIKVNEGDIVRFLKSPHTSTNYGAIYDDEDNLVNTIKANGVSTESWNTFTVIKSVSPSDGYYLINMQTSRDGLYNMIMINMEFPADNLFIPYYKEAAQKYIKESYINRYFEQNDFLWGKKLYVAGDSISYGARADVDSNGNRKTYDYYISKRHNMTVVKDAISGSALSLKDGRTDHYSGTRYLNMPSDADYYIFEFGTNDTADDGSINTATNETYLGAWDLVLNHLLTINPSAKVLIIPLWTGSQAKYDGAVTASKTFGCGCLAWEDVSCPHFARWRNGIRSSVNTTKKATFLADGTHPNDLGYRFLSTIVESALKNL